MPPEDRKRKKPICVFRTLWPNFEQLCTTQEQNKEEHKPQRLLAESKARISMPKFRKCFRDFYNIGNKILSFQSEPVCAKKTCTNYSIGRDQDEAEIQYDFPKMKNVKRCQPV